jgi:regulator of RNase E activity RraA
VPIEVGGVPVHDGDLIGADYDGCVVVPRHSTSQLFKKYGVM